jgi:hypothetical protein
MQPLQEALQEPYTVDSYSVGLTVHFLLTLYMQQVRDVSTHSAEHNQVHYFDRGHSVSGLLRTSDFRISLHLL